MQPRIALILLSALWSLPGVADEPVPRNPAWPDDLVVFQHVEQVAVAPLVELRIQAARILNRSADGRTVAVVDLPVGSTIAISDQRSWDLELLLLAGQLDWNRRTLGKNGYVFLPADEPAPEVRPVDESRALVFLDPGRGNRGRFARALDTETLDWRPGVVAHEDTGRGLELEVKDLFWDEVTGQRTWLLRAGPDLTVPWERHTTVEEGFLLEGDYRLAECLPGGVVVGDYGPGGYFYRPPGIVHSGPASGTKGGVLWLLRTPARLTVEFVPDCPYDAE